METEFRTIAAKVINSKRIRSRKRLLIFSLCLSISIFFWLLIKFSKNYQLTVDCPVSFINIPPDRVLMNNADTSLKITIKSKGYNLLYYQFFKHKIHFNIDASQLKLTDVKKDTTTFIGATQFSKIFNRQLDFNYDILSVQPDTFALNWEKAYIKKLAVKPNLVLNFAKQYQLYDSIRIQPDSILVSGCKSDLEKIAFLSCTRMVLNNLSESQEVVADIVLPANLSKLKLYTQKVKINIAVEKFTEAELEIDVKALENTNFKKIKLFPDKVKITYLVALKDFKKVNRESIEAVADINASKNDLSADVRLTKFPSFIKISKIYPERLEYIIFK